MKSVGGVRKLRHRGGARVNWQFLFTAAAYNLVRLRNLGAATPWPPGSAGDGTLPPFRWGSNGMWIEIGSHDLEIPHLEPVDDLVDSEMVHWPWLLAERAEFLRPPSDWLLRTVE